MAKGLLERMFKLSERNTTVRTEILGGATTFVTMAYIIIVNPAILSFAGIPHGPGTVATILAAVFGSLVMGLYANRPIAVAPYMGENAFIAFGLAPMGIGCPQLFGAVFVSGCGFFVITLLRIRSWLANSISASMKHSFAVGIGLFLAFIGLYETGIVTSFVTGMSPQALLYPNASVLHAPDVPVKIGNLKSPEVLLALFGFFLISMLLYHRVRGGILLGIALTVVLQIFSANLRNIASAEDHVYASAKAAARMRELLDSDTLSETTWTETTRDGYSMDVSVSELLKDRTSNLPMKLLQVDLTIHWLKGKRDKSLTLRTIKTIDRS